MVLLPTVQDSLEYTEREQARGLLRLSHPSLGQRPWACFCASAGDQVAFVGPGPGPRCLPGFKGVVSGYVRGDERSSGAGAPRHGGISGGHRGSQAALRTDGCCVSRRGSHAALRQHRGRGVPGSEASEEGERNTGGSKRGDVDGGGG